MKLLEHEGKEIFRRYGIPVPPSGGVITKPAQLSAALKRAGKGPWVIKAQVLAGGRGKAGGVKIAKTPKEASEIVKKMLGMRLITPQTGEKGIKVDTVLVDKASDITREIYISVVLDRKLGCPVVIASAEGGVEIEELAKHKPHAILREPVDPSAGLKAFQARRLAFALRIPPERLSDFTKLATGLVNVFLASTPLSSR